MTRIVDPSPEAIIVQRLVAELGTDGAHRAIDEICSQLSNVERSALAAHSDLWLRSKQKPPPTAWRSWGNLTARGWGKTRAIALHINDEVQAGRAMRIGLAAQNETKTIAVQVEGLTETAPHWCKPTWIASALRLEWPNGAVALAFTPEVPGAIRSENFDLSWICELQSWPVATREEAYSNFLFATRVGYARTIWDATPKRGHPILKRLLARAAAEPEKHLIIRGSIYENPHLAAGVVADMEREYAGTTKGREELHGEMIDEAEAALFQQEWIDAARRHLPDALVRRVLGIDPAVTNRAGNDRTGIIEAALGTDGQCYVMRDLSGRYGPGEWARIVVDLYIAARIDLIVAETNKGGDLIVQNLRAEAGRRKLSVVVLGKQTRAPSHTPGTIYVREVFARGPKEDRAQPLATAYERGRVSHVIGADLAPLEETLTTWEPTPGHRSPDALDALVHAATELLGLADGRPDAKTNYRGIADLGRALAAARPRPNVGALLSGGRVGGRI